MFRIILFLALGVTGVFANEPVFDWEEEPAPAPKLDTKKANPLPVPPSANQNPKQPGINNPGSLFQDPFFSRDPDFDAIQKRFRDRQKAMMDRMMKFFNGSGMGMPFKDPFDDPFFQIPGRNKVQPPKTPGNVPTPPQSSPNLKKRFGAQVPNPMSQLFSRQSVNSPKFIDKGDLLLVELQVSNARNSEFKVKVQGNMVQVTQVTQSSQENQDENSRSQFQSYSSSSQSFTLPTKVKKNFVQNLVGDTLVLTFRKQ